MGEAIERTEMAKLECKNVQEPELSGLLSEENRPERHRAKTGVNVDKSPRTMTEANPQLVSFQGSPKIQIHLHMLCFQFQVHPLTPLHAR